MTRSSAVRRPSTNLTTPKQKRSVWRPNSGSVPLTVDCESACDCGGITAGRGVGVQMHQAAGLEFVGDGLDRHSGSPSIRRVIAFKWVRRVSPSTSASSGCMTATLIALDSIAACSRASTPASVPSRAA
jgi:hypothetical protein